MVCFIQSNKTLDWIGGLNPNPIQSWIGSGVGNPIQHIRGFDWGLEVQSYGALIGIGNCIGANSIIR